MAQADTVIENGLVVTPGRRPERADIVIAGGRIVDVPASARGVARVNTIDAAGKHVLPGPIDGHTHFGYGDGRQDQKLPSEDFLTETRAAALGGITSVFTFYRRPEPYVGLVERHIAAAEERAYIDFGFHLGLQIDAHLDELPQYFERYGITSFKMYMAYRGAEGAQIGITNADDGYMYEAFGRLAKLPQAVCAVHCENMDIIGRRKAGLAGQGREDLAAWSESRPAVAEAEAVRRATYLAAAAGARIYIPHLSCREALRQAAGARAEFGSDGILIETCPHYLTHTFDSPEGPLAKVNTPLRSADDQEALWGGIADGTIDTIGSDHLAIDRARKRSIWDGIPGLPGVATLLPVMLSEGVNRRSIPIERIAAVVAENPARIWGLFPRKGSLQPGTDADLVVVDLELEREVHAADLRSAADYSLYEGRTLRGWPVLTMVRGEVVARDGSLVGRPGYGRYLRRD
ncbi:MAG: dihydropyrimidinase [Chloroflexota bacterium]|nr:dihydropyrimidinase [Chloroflexota bacterium]